MKRHCTIGATIEVYHHVEGYIGDVKKIGGHFCPIKIVKPIMGTRLPDYVSLDPETLDEAELEGWMALRDKVIKMFTEEPKEEKNEKQWRKGGMLKNKSGWK